MKASLIELPFGLESVAFFMAEGALERESAALGLTLFSFTFEGSELFCFDMLRLLPGIELFSLDRPKLLPVGLAVFKLSLLVSSTFLYGEIEVDGLVDEVTVLTYF